MPNTAYATWLAADQRASLIIQSSLSEEAMAETIGMTSSRDLWQALEATYSHDSVERMQTLCDSLRQLKKGNTSVIEYGRKFKLICDQLFTIGHPVSDADKTDWFLCGLGSTFETFATVIRVTKPKPSFHDILSQAESHEIFINTMHGSSSTPPVATFNAQTQRPTNNSRGGYSGTRGGRSSSSRGGSSSGRGHGKRPPHCQLCRKNGYYASSCPNLSTFAQNGSSPNANLAAAFHSPYNVNNNTPNCYVDSGASAHMTNSHTNLDSLTTYTRKDQVVFGNGNVLNISHIGKANFPKTFNY